MSYDIHKLFIKYKEGSLTPEEENYLMQWYNKYSEDKKWSQFETKNMETDLKILNDYKYKIKKNVFKGSKWVIAACVLLLGAFAYVGKVYYFNLNSDKVILAGSQKAELLLHSGEHLDLDSLSSFEPIVKGNVKIEKDKSGILHYTALNENNDEETFDELKTPKGGDYVIQLVDGTKIWLNANSTLRFYTSTKSSKREVWLEGEGYFEVKKDKHRPFIVYSNSQEITVTGTSFNVRSGARSSQTTLIEGGVSINKGAFVLAPGQQLNSHNAVDGRISEVDVDEFVAWKNGYFMYNNRPLSQVLKELADWYDVEFQSEGVIKDHKIWATMSRYKNLDEVLKMIELTESAKFIRKGRRVFISQ